MTFALLAKCIFCSESLITKSYLTQLSAIAPFQVVPYQDNVFKGWTLDDAISILDPLIPSDLTSENADYTAMNLPSAISWKGSCSHSVRDQFECGASWAFAVSGMLSDLCCLELSDYGWLSPQELVSCDHKNHGCEGGWANAAMGYIQVTKGLVREECYPYKGIQEDCPNKCNEGKDWSSSHICGCVKGYKSCIGINHIKECLTAGPITLAMGVCRSFYGYGGGIYICDCKKNYLGIQTVEVLGFGSHPVCHWFAKNSWGPKWGESGHFRIACRECGIDGHYPNGNIMCKGMK